MLAAYEALAGDVDIIHDHTDLGPLLAGRRGIARPPVVTTIHGQFTAQNRRRLAEVARHASIVAISHAHARASGPSRSRRSSTTASTWTCTSPAPGPAATCCSSAGCPPTRACTARCGSPGAPAGRWSSRRRSREPAERAYFEQQVRPLLGPDDDMLAEQPLAARLDLMGGAAALLNPITWPEPFGLVMAEALASATPVLAFPSGAAPEIIDHGRTGYLCRDEDEMVTAVARVPEIQRRQCRAAAEQRFSLARMAPDHQRLYRPILQHPGEPVPTGRDRVHRDRTRGPGASPK